jgi:hypothetical protein
MYRHYFGGLLQGTTTSVELNQVHPVESGYAFADADQTVYAANGDVGVGIARRQPLAPGREQLETRRQSPLRVFPTTGIALALRACMAAVTEPTDRRSVICKEKPPDLLCDFGE